MSGKSTGARGILSAVLLLAGGDVAFAQWQVNQSGASVTINGTQGTSLLPNVFVTAAGAPVAVGLSSTTVGQGWEVLVTSGPGVPAGGGALVTAGGQIVNINLSDPTLTFLNNLTFPPFASMTVPVSFPAPAHLSFQMAVLDPTHPPDGFWVSAITGLHVAPLALWSAANTALLAHNGNYYCLTAAPMPWRAAQARAAWLGGNLVAINTLNERDWVLANFNPSGAQAVWTGYTDAQTEGTWQWVGGDPTGVTCWHPGEPNDAGPGEDYSLMATNNVSCSTICPGLWIDIAQSGDGTPYWPPAVNGKGQYGVIEIAPARYQPLRYFNGKYYCLTSAPLTWTAAEAEAVALGGHLVAINDAQEQAWLTSNFDLPGIEVLWIGATDAAAEGSWTWTTGEPFAYSNWGGIEPNNLGDEDVAMMQTLGSSCCASLGPGKWADILDIGRGSFGNWPYGILNDQTGQYGIIEIPAP
jgi:hypothetical protein